MKVHFEKINLNNNKLLKYAIIISRAANSKWVYVQHRLRETWELPAGHIEPGEDPMDAAKRELFEETGALVYTIREISDYHTNYNNKKTYGRIYYAEIEEFGMLPDSEIARIDFYDNPPKNLTYPELQDQFFEYVLSSLALK